jgi:hypothetical protein
MEDGGVQYACLNGIGCGAFKGWFRALPTYYARALARVLSGHTFRQLKAVVLSLPDVVNYQQFVTELDGHRGTMRVTVVLTQHHSMQELADKLSRRRQRAGILVPADIVSTYGGRIGMYWDGGDTKLEEALALQTTLLASHMGCFRVPWPPATNVVTVDRSKEMVG